VVTPVVSRRNDDHDAVLPGGLNGLAQRIVDAVVGYRAAERQIDDANVVLRFELDGAADGGEHRAVGTLALSIENAQVYEFHVRGDAADVVRILRAARISSSSANNARDMVAMPVFIVGIVVAGD